MTRIAEATTDQSARAAQILADSFQDDPVWCWLIPDQQDRATLLPRFFETQVRQALTNGRVLIAGPDLGSAVWIRLDGTSESRELDEDDEEEMSPVFRPYLDRMATLDQLMRAAHPYQKPHHYLALIGVRPDARGSGIGSALLRQGLPGPSEQRDATYPDDPAYLEASSERNKALYERHGFRDLGEPIRLPDGPTLHPMWREPHRPEAHRPEARRPQPQQPELEQPEARQAGQPEGAS